MQNKSKRDPCGFFRTGLFLGLAVAGRLFFGKVSQKAWASLAFLFVFLYNA